MLAGNSIHCDRGFIQKYMPDFLSWLHYRIIDVSSVESVARLKIDLSEILLCRLVHRSCVIFKAYHFENFDFEILVEGEGHDTSRHF